ncbi:MAG: DUF2851 family protein [Porphyromonadaceae bacterium]|nr:DUF2851 family protein [Porphyromonadaceae bacterium]
MEALLHLIWQQRLYTSLSPTLHDTWRELEVIDTGLYNADAGPDFLNAKIRIDGILWSGDVEIHQSAQEWYQHRHQHNPLYQSVVLHLVVELGAPTYDLKGRLIPSCQMTYPEVLNQRACYLVHHSQELPCAPLTNTLTEPEWQNWYETLLHQRLEHRLNVLHDWMGRHQSDRLEALYMLLMRYFGFGLNNDAMERLARNLPLRYLLKHRDQLHLLEALLLGQAGLLSQLPQDAYTKQLRQEHQFLAHKYQLAPPLPSNAFRLTRTRPASFPTRRLVQIANLIHRHDFLSDLCLEIDSERALKRTFDVELKNTYWLSHASWSGKGRLSETSVRMLGINVVIPYQSLVAELDSRSELRVRANQLLKSLPAEDNRPIRLFARAGLTASNASDSQALLELYKMYCQRRKCLFCHFGRAKMCVPLDKQTQP